MPHYVYMLSNPSMPGLLKIGKTTTSPDQRMAELHSTGVPLPFTLELSFEVDDCHHRERLAHGALHDYRVAGNREFFRVSVQQAIDAMRPELGRYEVREFNKSNPLFAALVRKSEELNATLGALEEPLCDDAEIEEEDDFPSFEEYAAKRRREQSAVKQAEQERWDRVRAKAAAQRQERLDQEEAWILVREANTRWLRFVGWSELERCEMAEATDRLSVAVSNREVTSEMLIEFAAEIEAKIAQRRQLGRELRRTRRAA